MSEGLTLPLASGASLRFYDRWLQRWREWMRADTLAYLMSETPDWKPPMNLDTKPRILISEFMDDSAVAALASEFDVIYQPDLVDRPADLLEAARHADALIVRNRTQVRGELLAALKRAKVIGRLGVGLDNIDVSACQSRQIGVIPASGANAQAVAEYVIASIFLLLRGAYFSSSAVGAGQWPRTALSNGREIAGKQLGLVGFGFIGQLTAKLARGLGLTVVAHDPALAPDAPVWAETGVTPLGLDSLLGSSDIVSLHVPLLPQTCNLIDAERLSRFKPGAILINSARGGVVDEVALAAALSSGQLGGAALDVFDAEPLPAGSPLADAPNLLLTPHIAGLTVESNQRVSALVAERVAQALRSSEVNHGAH
ncbi:MAG: 3-phosphoglycerate dehydrogenase [Proteobacteria bacterium]|nr:3-phosphoglycerate dehydrogenase [Pseudomonadota bacterium]